MPAPDPTAPEVLKLLHDQLSLDQLKAELKHQQDRLDNLGDSLDDDMKHIIHTWMTAIRGEIARRG
ncbi:MAG: hypothetical protein WCF04_10225 [Candidatus Nanopelagicales bacterium]